MTTYTAYTISHYESVCGCENTTTWPVYDLSGNCHQRFSTEVEARNAAFNKMLERGADSYRVVSE